MTKKVKDTLDYALRKCRLIPVESRKQRVYAVVTDRKGRVLSEASNDYKSSCFLQRRYAIATGNEDKLFNHAECLALQRLGASRSKAYRITVVRVLKNGESALSSPCEVCQEAIKKYGIKCVEYSL